VLVYLVTLQIVNVDGTDPAGHRICVAVVPPTKGTLMAAPCPATVPCAAVPPTSVPCRPFPLMSVNRFRVLSQLSAVAAKYGGCLVSTDDTSSSLVYPALHVQLEI
jgi:hypothetical protein